MTCCYLCSLIFMLWFGCSFYYSILLYVQFNSQGSSVASQSGVGLGVQSPGLSGIASTSLPQPPNSVHSPSSQQSLLLVVSKDAGIFCVTLIQLYDLLKIVRDVIKA